MPQKTRSHGYRPATAHRIFICCLALTTMVVFYISSSRLRVVEALSITTLGVPITQNFDTLATTGTTNPWTDDSTLPGWFSQFSLQPANPTVYRGESGTGNAGAIYSYGVAGTNPLTERAFGSASSGTPGTIFNALKLTNDSGSTITSLDISFNGEQWRQGGCQPLPCTPAAQKLDFQYQVAAAGVITDANTPGTGWVDEDTLDFTTPQPGTSTAAAIDGNAAANRTAKSGTITVSVSPGQEIWLRWMDINDANNDHGFGIDDVSITPQGAGGGGPSLSINDVTQAEGNSGITNFTFTVSLNTPAGVNGVTFDVNTADGTAQDDNPATEDNDYVALSTSGSITSGNTSTSVTVQVNGDAVSEANETFFVNINNVVGATLGDGQGQGNITNDDFTLVPIHSLQGNSTSSPFVGQLVTTSGIVTLLKTSTNTGGVASGFFLQDPLADADPNTSEGIFVFTSSVPFVGVGDEVTVSGTVVEFNGLTEISSVTNVTVIDTGNSLPTPVTLDTTILDSTALATQPQLEKFESMRVAASSLTVVSPNDNFFDVDTVLSSVPRQQVFREPGIPVSDPVPPDPTGGTPDCCIPIWDENPERLSVDTNGRAGAPLNPYTSNVVFMNVGGPLDFSFGRYRMVAEATPMATPNMTAVPVPTPLASEFTVVGYNIENFNNNATQREKAALTVRTILHYPDIIGAVEIFDLADLQALRDEINNDAVAAGDPNPLYQAFLVEQDGTSEDSDQDVGFLVKTARVSVTSVTQEREEETFVEPGTGNVAILHDRPPLVLDAQVEPAGANIRVLVVVNHLRSFIDAELVAGDGPRVREKRKLQAESLGDLLNDLQTSNPNTSVISVGDYNAFQFSSGYDDSVSVVIGNPTPDNQIVVDQSPDVVDPNFINLIEDVPADQRYSFVFEGTPQVLDQILVNRVANSRNTRIAIPRVNADFPEVPAAVFVTNAATPERNSDHDPAVAYFTLGAPTAAPATISGQVTTTNGEPLAGVTMLLSGPRAAKTISDSNGNYSFANVDTDAFYTVRPVRLNYHFGPVERSFSLIGNKTDAVFTATANEVIAGSAIDTPEYFVRQHYLDFLGREPDHGGFNFWSDQILECGGDASCAERRRINVSAAYFLSIEFQATGGVVDRLYRASYGRAPRYAEFMPDTATVAQGVIVGDGEWTERLRANKQAFVDAWVQRAAFRATYDGLSNDAFVDTLISNTGVAFTPAERGALVGSLNSGSATRATVLRQVAENEQFALAKRNEAFVMMEYFGYLRRDPDAAGLQFWVNKLDQFGGNFEQAEMVKAFINSGEYRARFPR